MLLAALFSLATAYLNWALCLVACALFLPFIVRRNPRADLRVLIAASYLGIGTVWHGGLSGSAPLILATPGNPVIAPPSGTPLVDRLYPVTETLFSAFNLAYIAIAGAVAVVVMLALHPRRGAVTLSPGEVNAILPRPPAQEHTYPTPAGWLDTRPFWVWLAALLLDEGVEPALGVLLDRLHRARAVEQEIQVGEVGVGHASPFEVVPRRRGGVGQVVRRARKRMGFFAESSSTSAALRCLPCSRS